MQENIFNQNWVATARAWAVHLYTSLGLPLGLLALIALIEGRIRDMAFLMALAMFIDGTDGPLARRWQVNRWVPHFDGRKLDDITDYLNYAFLPIYFIYHYQLIPANTVWVLVVVLIAAAYGFCQGGAKTDDKFFTGFPNYWNFVAFYMYLLNLPPLVNVVILLLLAMLVFVPIKYMSTQSMLLKLPRLSYFLFFLWGVNVLWVLVELPNPNPTLVWLSLGFPLYHTALSLYLNVRPQAGRKH